MVGASEMDDNGGVSCCEQGNVSDSVKIFSCGHTVNPKPFLSGLLETGVVALGFGSEGVDFF